MRTQKCVTGMIRRQIALLVVVAMAIAMNPVNTTMVYATEVTAENGTTNDQNGTNTATTDGTTNTASNETNNDTSGTTTGDNTTSTDAAATGTEGTTAEASTSTESNSTTTSADNSTTEAVASTETPSTATIVNPEMVYTGLSPADAKVLVIDPGHCNIHPGAYGNGLREEAVNLDISLAMYDYLLDYGDITVYMTREDGGCCRNLGAGSDCLYARSNYAQQLEADFLVSVHINAGRLNGANALVAYNSGYHDNVRKETQAFGRIALKELKKIGITNRGFLLRKSGSGSRYNNGKLADYYALVRRGVVDQIPAVIMEHGYITSASDCKKFFKTKAKRSKVGVADAKAVISYYNLSKKIIEGSFVTEDGATYYKNSAGQKVGGWVKDDGSWYYFDEMTGQMHTGFLTQGDNMFYLNPTTGEMKIGEFKSDGNTYMARGNGTLVRAAIHIDNFGSYLYDLVGRKLSKGLHTIDSNTYYVVSNKKVARGLTKIGSKYYGFDSTSGKMLYGSQTIGKKNYYFDKETGVAAKNKMVVIDDETYYYGSKAAETTGWVKYKGAKYYFEKGSAEMVTGWKKINGKYYYFEEDTGKMAKSKWIGKYYVNKKGVRTKKK